ncbi:hypothetical protein M406DRAFT_343800 [Cryphonectria parasitica EP155]|uniref:Fatty acid hydroxylase domain-containing protein n=1 Tax=Cryphonectria parasitica (strain ATCC 38755 / EP155) TaxID=660469 RepID=A0A9P4YAY1_CRYP1|nr:uncharacterized protein M406DRAFT_343800 [Cryphonectria parasitica EP155]KAF3769664.1 hypothetical protein M406DRAFT_343800 [Cryphonectria parasitica EP155]
MDVVLEVLDTFGVDYIYATLYPAHPASYNFQNPPANQSIDQQVFSTWVYKPSTEYFSLEPSKYAYMSAWPRDNIFRQALSLFFIVWLFGFLLYFAFASLSYCFVFDKKTMEHPKYLRNQIGLEIKQTLAALPGMSVCTTVMMLLEVRGYCKLYDVFEDAPFPGYNWIQYPFFIMFTDFCIYWIHRWLHHPLIYKRLHKPHHKWIMPTPFASHAFHPLDGFAQSLPYHIFPLIFPLQKVAFLLLFVIVNIWTILIHDGEFVSDNPVINGAACHSIHHLAFNYNYGQYTTLWDRLGGSYRKPDRAMFDKEKNMSKEQWEKQSREMEKIVKVVEGEDDRSYEPKIENKKTR